MPRRRLLPLPAIIAAFFFLTGASAADTRTDHPGLLDGFLSVPVQVQHVRHLLSTSGAGADQAMAAAMVHEEATRAFRALHEEALPALLARSAFADQLSRMDGTFPDAGRVRAASAVLDGMYTQLTSLDDALLIELAALFPEAPAALDDLRRHRARRLLLHRLTDTLTRQPLLNADLLGSVRRLDGETDPEVFAAAIHRARAFDDAILSLTHAVANILPQRPLEYISEYAATSGIPAGTALYNDEQRNDVLDAAWQGWMNQLRSARRMIYGKGTELLREALGDLDGLLPPKSAARLRLTMIDIRAPQSAWALRGAIDSVHALDRAITAMVPASGAEAQMQEALRDAVQGMKSQLQDAIETTVRLEEEWYRHSSSPDPSDEMSEDLFERRQRSAEQVAALADELEKQWTQHTGSPPPMSASVAEPYEPPALTTDHPHAAALGVEHPNALSLDQFLSIDWALPPPIRGVHLSSWRTLLGLSADQEESLRARTAELAAETRSFASAQRLRALARRFHHRPDDGPEVVPLREDELPLLARTRETAAEEMLEADAAFFESLAEQLDLTSQQAGLLPVLQDDRVRDILTRPAPARHFRFLAPRSHAWWSSPVTLLAEVEGLNTTEAGAALLAAAPHLTAMTNTAREHFRAAVRFMEIDEQMRIAGIHVLSPQGERAAAHVAAAAHALNDHFHTAAEAMTAALTPRSAIRFQRQVRRHVYIPHFQDEPDIGSEIFLAIEQSGPGDPRTDAITELLLFWREADEQLVAEMTELINRTTDAADDVSRIRHELELRKFLRAEHADRTLLRLDALYGTPRW